MNKIFCELLLSSKTVSNRTRPNKNAITQIRNISQCNEFDWPDFAAGINFANTPPVSWYVNHKFYEKVEKKSVFNTWLNVGRVESIQNEGDYLAFTVLDQPVVVIKTKDGSIKAYFNVCRHHAAQLCEDGAGSIGVDGRFTCPYHGWQYNAEGKLTKAIKMKGCQNFHPKQFGLHSLPVNIIGPWIYLKLGHPNQVTSSEDSSLFDEFSDAREVFQILDNTGYHNMKHIKSRSYEINCNWKVFIDNYLDGGYHVPVAHPGLSAHLDLTNYQRKGYENFHIQSCPSASTSQSVGNTRITGGTNRTAVYIYQYPNICINRYGQWMDTNIVWPINENKCRVEFDWFVESALYHHPDANEIVEKSLEDSHQVQLEDIWLCERVQKGLKSFGYVSGRYAPTLEGNDIMNVVHEI